VTRREVGKSLWWRKRNRKKKMTEREEKKAERRLTRPTNSPKGRRAVILIRRV